MSLASQVGLLVTRIGQEFKKRAPKSARFYRNSYGNLNNASALIPLSSVDYNDDATIFQQASNGMQVLKAGLYSVDYSASLNAPVGYSSLYVQKNGTTVFEVGNTFVAGAQRIAASFKVRLAVNDVLTLNAYSGGALTMQGTATPYDLGLAMTFLGI